MKTLNRSEFTQTEDYILALEEHISTQNDIIKSMEKAGAEIQKKAEMAYEDLRIAEDKNDELQNQISNLKDKASESVSSIIKERQDYKILKDKVENLSAECDYLKRVINLQLRNNVEVWRLEDISNTKPIVLKLQENIGNEIIVRIERG